MRVYLGGEGEPIPDIALPDLHGGAVVPIVLLMEDAEVFRKEDYESLGYNYFQAWCIGGAGGWGADTTDSYVWAPEASYTRTMTYTEWEIYVSLFWMPYYQILDPARYDPVSNGYFANPDGSFPYIYITGRQYAEWWNPTHQAFVYPYHDPYLVRDRIGSSGVMGWSRYGSGGGYTTGGGLGIQGGGGGGGGLQVVTGRLEDLPDEVLCTIGATGSNASKALDRSGVAFDPVPESLYMNYAGGNKFNAFPDPHPLFQPAQPGGDGGASSFGDICMASGGKGGRPTTYFDVPSLGANDAYPVETVNRWFDARGGDGGAGGRLLAGGGGAGGKLLSAGGEIPDLAKDAGKDGSWDPNTGIGHGGGGGRGGYFMWPVYIQENPAIGLAMSPQR